MTIITVLRCMVFVGLQCPKRSDMKTNMGSFDRIIRVFAAAIIAVLYGTHLISGTLAIVFLIIAGIFFITGVIGNCPLYTLFGVRTKATDSKPI